MEEIDLTHGQFQILLNMTRTPKSRRSGPAAHLVSSLHEARVSGHKWLMKMTEEDIETALDLFQARLDDVRTPGHQQALHFFVRSSPTARRFFDARQAQADVPRETSKPGDE